MSKWRNDMKRIAQLRPVLHDPQVSPEKKHETLITASGRAAIWVHEAYTVGREIGERHLANHLAARIDAFRYDLPPTILEAFLQILAMTDHYRGKLRSEAILANVSRRMGHRERSQRNDDE